MKARRRLTHLRFRKGDTEHNLLAAVQHYVKAKGGSVLVIGPVQVISDRDPRVLNFKIAVGCLGRRPVPKS